MKIRRVLFAILLICAMALIFTACGKESEKHAYSFDGLKDVHVSVREDAYDFTEGVTAFKDLAEIEFLVDSSAVVFGTSGVYQVKYRIDEHEQTANVYIYDDPEFTSTDSVISYADAQSSAGVCKGLAAKDSFGNELTVTVTAGITAATNGYIEYGNHAVSYSATDRTGNTATYSRTVTVSDSDKPVFSDMLVDLSDIEIATQFAGQTVLALFCDNVKLTTADYLFTNGYLTFKEAFILSKELGDYQLNIVTDAGYNTATLSVTDNQPATFLFGVQDMEYQTDMVLSKAEQYGFQKNITFRYTIEDEQGNEYVIKEGDDGLTFTPGEATVFTITATAYRNGTESAGAKSSTFKIQDNVYAWSVNANNEYSNVKYSADMQVGYTTDIRYGTDLGSTHIENTAETGSAVVMINFFATADVAVGSTLEFYVYNPTGEELESYIYTTSGWWESLGLNILTNRVTISASEGWHKVSLKFADAFDGTMSTMTGAAPGQADTQIRICKKSDWDWDKGNGNFGVNVSNIHLVKSAADYSIDYGMEGYVNNGMVGVDFVLPKASCQDPRIRFEYSLELSDVPVTFNEETFRFKPSEKGSYVFTTQVYFRDARIAVKTVDFNIKESSIGLAVAAYYTYDADGNVTLPAAAVVGEHAGKAVRYSVKLGENSATVLGENRVFATGKVNGAYTYIAEVLDTDGSTVLVSATATVNIHGGNVLIGFGRDANTVSGELGRELNPGAQYSYTTAKAAPGELGSLLINNDGHTVGEKGNISVQLGKTDIANQKLITFYLYHTAAQNLECRIYSATSGTVIDYWYNGTRYTSWDQFPIAPQEGWQKIEFVVGEKNLGGGEWNNIHLQFSSDQNNGYPWPESVPAEIYLSNIYCS